MLGAIIGDIVGSRFEFVEDHNRGKNFALFTNSCRITDDSLMTIAVARALFLCQGNYTKLETYTIQSMVYIAENHKNTLWGEKFYKWLFEDKAHKPYNSFGNGAGMRISPVGWVAENEKDVKLLSKIVTDVSHNHVEAEKGAEAIAMGVYLARIGYEKDEIKNRLANYYPILLHNDFTVSNLQKSYGYDDGGKWITCQGSVPHAIVCFLESKSFEDALRNAISIGGDSDTIGAMTGSIAEAFYGISLEMENTAMKYLRDDLVGLYYLFDTIKRKRLTKK